MTAQEKADRLYAVLAAGKTVDIATQTRTTRVTQKHVRSWAQSGRPLFKADSKSLYMACGKRYDCIDYCQITMWS